MSETRFLDQDVVSLERSALHRSLGKYKGRDGAWQETRLEVGLSVYYYHDLDSG